MVPVSSRVFQSVSKVDFLIETSIIINDISVSIIYKFFTMVCSGSSFEMLLCIEYPISTKQVRTTKLVELITFKSNQRALLFILVGSWALVDNL